MFPARVHLPDGRRIPAARVIVTGGAVRVFVTGPGRAAVAQFAADVSGEPTQTRRNGPVKVATPLGVVTWERSGACGCGDPMKKVTRDTLLALPVP